MDLDINGREIHVEDCTGDKFTIIINEIIHGEIKTYRGNRWYLFRLEETPNYIIYTPHEIEKIHTLVEILKGRNIVTQDFIHDIQHDNPLIPYSEVLQKYFRVKVLKEQLVSNEMMDTQDPQNSDDTEKANNSNQ